MRKQSRLCHCTNPLKPLLHGVPNAATHCKCDSLPGSDVGTRPGYGTATLDVVYADAHGLKPWRTHPRTFACPILNARADPAQSDRLNAVEESEPINIDKPSALPSLGR